MTQQRFLLSIDGGGALGIGPLEFLAAAERAPETREALMRVDAYAGTSVGALLVGLRAVGYTWGEARSIFEKECARIFAPAPLWWRLNPCRPLYDGAALTRAARFYLGTVHLDRLPVPLYLPSFDFATGRPKIWGPRDDVPLAYAVRCSTAAPTYFPIIDDRYGDGGLVANNPAMVGVAGCIAEGHADMGYIWCLSLGTNGDAWRDPGVGHRTKIGWLQPLLDTFMTGNEELGTYQARSLLGARLYRVEPPLGHEIALDDVRGALGSYRDLWVHTYAQQHPGVETWCERLRLAGESAR